MLITSSLFVSLLAIADKQPLLNNPPPTYGAPPPGYRGPQPPPPGYQGPPPGSLATAPPPPTGFKQQQQVFFAWLRDGYLTLAARTAPYFLHVLKSLLLFCFDHVFR